MVTAISNASTVYTSATANSSSDSTAETAALKSELASKQSELSQAKTADEKTKLTAEITKLKAEIAAMNTLGGQGTLDTSKAGGKSATAQVTSADKAAPEGKVSGAAMDVLMRLTPQGGMMGGPSGPGGPMNISQIYAQIDADSNGKVTKDEFVKGREPHMNEDQAGKMFSAMDTEKTGSITENQFAKSIKQGGPGGHPMGPPPAGMAPPQGDWKTAEAATSSIS